MILKFLGTHITQYPEIPFTKQHFVLVLFVEGHPKIEPLGAEFGDKTRLYKAQAMALPTSLLTLVKDEFTFHDITSFHLLE